MENRQQGMVGAEEEVIFVILYYLVGIILYYFNAPFPGSSEWEEQIHEISCLPENAFRTEGMIRNISYAALFLVISIWPYMLVFHTFGADE